MEGKGIRRAGRRRAAVQVQRVAQTCSLPYRGFGIRRALPRDRALPTASRRDSRLQICATALGRPNKNLRKRRKTFWHSRTNPEAPIGEID